MVGAQSLTAKETAGRLDIHGVGKIFHDAAGAEVVALASVDLTIGAGEFVCLLGPSGCGKSTLLRLIAGLDSPGAGVITLDGEKVTGPHYTRGLVFQDPTLFPWKTVRENVATGWDARGLPWKQRCDIDDYISLVGLDGFENAYPYQLSGGMAQRAALARALVNHPKVLLLDEPLGALDAFTRMKMQEEILRIWQDRGTTMVFVTHDIDEAVYLADRIIVMTPRPGKVVKIADVRLERPRRRNYPDFFRIRSEVLELFQLAHDDSPDYYL
ncbi:MAG: ABC transporter ATP-binding protein [Negativicutes bacterium]|nr:ABC transporter ATP-binding protein [Negativicutes bacterium]